MPFGGNDWLAQTPEAALEPALPIIDPHHHLWDKRIPRIPYQRYQLDELVEDVVSSGHNVVATVFVEARSMYRPDGPPELVTVGEVEYVQGIAAASASGLYGPTRIAAGIVGRADLGLGAGVGPVLDALQAASPNRFRGIRHIVASDPHPEIDPIADPRVGDTKSPAFIEGARVLAARGLSFDAWLYHHQMNDLVEFARAVPDLPIVLNHIGGLLRVGPYANRLDEVLAMWRSSIVALAACPNITVKVGGLGMPRYGFDWAAREVPIGSEELAAEMAPWLAYTIEQFGPDRCMFESNFPVDKVSFSYGVMWNAFKRFSTSYTPAERAAMFHDTAKRVYRLEI